MRGDLVQILEEIGSEVGRAESMFARFNSAHEGWAVLKEEVDELWEEVRKGGSTPKDHPAMRKEALQTAAMAVRFIRDVCDGRAKSEAA